jgi:alkanesulfonate monooxygenase SsuD/methylene tetrahydromethanopterin reductase-like flavin-dependent oxidoreductase (luciferase family)
VCDAVEGRFLQAADASGLWAAAALAEEEGAGAVFLADGPIGDAITLAGGLGVRHRSVLLGVLVTLSPTRQRHPTVLAREMTTLDHVCAGRSVLAFTPPFGDDVAEAAQLCRAMWRQGTAVSQGPHYAVPGAVNQPRPPSDASPQLALDLTDGTAAPPGLAELVDLLLRPTDRPGVCAVLPA